ncbi:protocatechuate 4,5-dioxygenase subunit alpha [Polymorphobacter megasporae]|uniref:protocatechuate 4,5-dioxygenase subunit alpha n=1 Tax=Glacieibacterium megasporae TaxID=2835787 RepID=UPI001C1E2307|nr:protocatechuate 4,5-dioxygenase subunit alpha [Polymorphobacter megasporae]UAJ09078.1 protocatechuate 4,5-dioxygenase subunit alpha [Polymorphobacter megasporae]
MDGSSPQGPGYDAADLADIPGTTIFTTASSRRAYQLHRFCMSLMKVENRAAFKADEGAYLDRFAMTPEQRQGVVDRDFNRLIGLGGNIYFLVKISNTDGWSVQRAVGTMAGMSGEDYAAMMIAGGRSPVGNRSIAGRH